MISKNVEDSINLTLKISKNLKVIKNKSYKNLIQK
jgi:hypothetical protein